ncbi:hypothetical protein [Pseudaestuariivita sp.]|uniref:hypothetical protein n=1 Tax=Pseudaestuariivita sp. TaxID=2211669 RepID=UPI00405A0901
MMGIQIDAAMDCIPLRPAIVHRIGGKKPGPTVIVSGFDPLIGPLYDRIAAVDALVFLNGTLLLTRADMPCALLDATQADEVIFLGYAEDDALEEAQTDAWWAVFGLLRRMGMIQGRGVPHV